MNPFPEVLPDLTEQKVLFPPIPVYDRRRQIFPEDHPKQKIQKKYVSVRLDTAGSDENSCYCHMTGWIPPVRMRLVDIVDYL